MKMTLTLVGITVGASASLFLISEAGFAQGHHLFHSLPLRVGLNPLLLLCLI
jgi:hypothetical protein